MLNPFIRKLERFGPFSKEERRVLNEAAARGKLIGPREDIIREGDHPEVHLILEGYACRYKLLPDGRRQIITLLVAGDFCDLYAYLLGSMDHGIGTLTPCRVAHLSRTGVQNIMDYHVRLAQAFWRSTLLDAAITREWVVGLGCRTAYERFAHLLCELSLRLRIVGLVQDDRFDLPLTRADLGEVLGMSSMHIGRMLQQLHREDLIILKDDILVIRDWERLTRAAQFTPDYLHLDPGNNGGQLYASPLRHEKAG